MLGIEAIEAGYRKFAVRPVLGGGLTQAKGGVCTPYGQLSVEWRIENGVFTITVQVPVSTQCQLTLPDGTTQSYGSGTYTASCPCQ